MTRHPALTQADFAYALRGADIHATRFAARVPLPPGLELADLKLVAAATVHRAAELWHPAKGASFKTYAWGAVGRQLVRTVQQWAHVPISRQRNIAAGRIQGDERDLRPISLEAFPGYLRDRADPVDVGEVVERRLLCRAALGALDDLLPADRELLELRFFGELSRVEIARRRGCTSTTVLNHERRALKALRERLDPEGATA